MRDDDDRARRVRVVCHRCQRPTEAQLKQVRKPRPGEDERAVSVAICEGCGAAVYPRAWIGSPK
jgi:NMD protein affecting ribosome stability and mRNA decay